KNLALGIVDFLQKSIDDGTVNSDDKESIEVAIQCISDVFGVDVSQKESVYGNRDLLDIYTAFEKVKEKSAAPKAPKTSDADADKLKQEGNAKLLAKDYEGAVECYTKALDISPENVVYLSNRAAAYSNMRKHELAAADAQKAIDIDPSYSKAYSRLGLAKFALGSYHEAVDAYQRGIDVEGNGGSDAMRKGLETAKAKANELDELAAPSSTADSSSSAGAGAGASGMPDLSSLASMFGGAGGSGGGGFDFASMMNNPQIMQMAQQMMSNPNVASLMNNPQIKSMAENLQNNPDGLQGLLNNPDIANLAKSFMGG
ncbi:hypothetical protein CANCADRAFT_16715, partial [Tortispora caseinolytica NRRL Y-17796]